MLTLGTRLGRVKVVTLDRAAFFLYRICLDIEVWYQLDLAYDLRVMVAVVWESHQLKSLPDENDHSIKETLQ